jgi:hypothetical protein
MGLDLYHPKAFIIAHLSLDKTAYLVKVALPAATWDTPLPPSEHFWTWRLVRVLFSKETQGLKRTREL